MNQKQEIQETRLQQTTKKNRIDSVDALRGFALLGIIIANIPYQANSTVSGELDSLMTFLFHFLVDKKFITIFSILFGFGFYIQMQRAAEKNVDFKKYFIVRMLLLFGIGSLHSYLLWNGDIIMTYAVGGLFLLALRNLSLKKLLVLAIILNVVLTGALYIGLTALGWASHNYNFELAREVPVATSFLRYLKLNFMFNPWTNFLRDMPLTIAFTFGNMLIGFILAKVDFFSHPEKHGKLTTWVITLGMTFGLAASFIFYKLSVGELELDYSLIWVPFVLVAGMILQSLFYISAFLKLYQFNSSRKVLQFFKPVGRTALSNYILQSFLYVFVFYHCFNLFNLFGKLTNFQSWMIAIGFYVFQTVITYFYLKRFNQGPIEFIWKKYSYKMAKPKKQTL
ncbi:DUF418 domain-containing protein [Draconibacterium sp. IB214405]|uniref:DUF418 domain-containing protein n=1 Tax=Draconibacterium sp. IB214405 TaxID=3097352 RepID=UPI002A14D1B6|nr:DUF418 domain-containing protein [Draconibacterium sp. IB214405]MDX8338793.1 DUF418 domain-containing protein [Draconibacterium sp. IB214405]